MPHILLLLCLPAALLLLSCSPNTDKQDGFALGDTVKLRYATGFEIIHSGDSTQITVFNPWVKGSIFAQYRLHASTDGISSIQNQHIANNLERIGSFSSTAIGYLTLLNAQDRIGGVADGDLLYDTALYDTFAKGLLPSLGMHMVDSYEAIIDANLDALVKSGFEQSPAQDARYCGVGIPIIYVNDWTETHPLARAEWIKFIACFIGKSAAADSVFDNIESGYLHAKERAAGYNKSPKVLAGGEYKGTWYVPGGKSYFAQLLSDAHASYAWAEDSTVGSISLSLETVFDKSADAECWLSSQDVSPGELIKRDKRMLHFNCITNNRLFTYNKRIGAGGGNDYWESGPCRPDIILQDFIAIIHGQNEFDSLFYFTQLQDITRHVQNKR